MRLRHIPTFALVVVSLLAGAGRARSESVPDPCKLVSEEEIHDTLALANPVVLRTHAEAAPQETPQFVSGGFGALWLEFRDTSRKDDFICEGRAGDILLSIRVCPVKEAEAGEQQTRNEGELTEKKWGHSFEKKWGYRVESSMRGPTTCEKSIAPDSDLLGRVRNLSDPMVAGMDCYENKADRHVAIGLSPWSPRRMPPVLLENLRVLVAKAASRL